MSGFGAGVGRPYATGVLEPSALIAFVSTADAARARRFYGEVLRMRFVEFDRHDGMEQDELGVWQSPSGARVAWFKDPDGNILSLTQFQF